MLQSSAVWQPIQGIDERTLFLSLYLHHDILIAGLRPVGQQSTRSVKVPHGMALQSIAEAM